MANDPKNKIKIHIYCLLIDKRKKRAYKVWSKDLVHEKTFQLSSRIAQYIFQYTT